MRELDPTTEWGDTEELLAQAVDALHGGNWQRGGGKSARPKAVPRPGVEIPSESPERVAAREAYRQARETARG